MSGDLTTPTPDVLAVDCVASEPVVEEEEEGTAPAEEARGDARTPTAAPDDEPTAGSLVASYVLAGCCVAMSQCNRR